MKESIVIIGGGIGGLVCGALLSKEGYRVTVLEKHITAGGGLHMFEWDGVSFETGMHVISGFEETGVLRRLFTYLGIIGQLNIRFADEDQFDVFYIESENKYYRFGRGRENFIRSLAAYFPEEEKNIRAYVDRIYEISKSVSLFNLEKPTADIYSRTDIMGTSIGDFIASFTDNEKLQAVLAWNNSLYAGQKYQTPAYVAALITKFYIEGAARFIGGSQQLADALAGVITSHGGEVITGDAVDKIDIEDKKISGVMTRKGKVYTAGKYISAIHTSAMFDLMDVSKIQRSYYSRLDNIPNSYSVFTAYIKLKPGTFPYFNYTLYYQQDYSTTWKYAEYTEENWPQGAMIITPPETDHDIYAEKMIVNCVMNFSTVEKWKDTSIGERGEEYEAFKKRYEQKILDILERLFPGFRDKVDAVCCASPLTIRDYYGTKNGAVYGTTRNCNNMAASHIAIRTKLENLFLTGQNLNLHGILGVPLTAISTCGELVGLPYLLDKINDGYTVVRQ